MISQPSNHPTSSQVPTDQIPTDAGESFAVTSDSPPTSKKSHSLLKIAGILSLTIILLGGLMIVSKSMQPNNPSTDAPQPSPTATPTPSASISASLDMGSFPGDGSVALFKVEQETIYQSDYDRLANAYPTEITDEVKKQIELKLKSDSLLVQEAMKRNLITSTEETYNSATKDPIKRKELVEKAKEELQKDEDFQSYEGEYVSIWFMNVEPGPAGYEAGKKIAFEKISALHNLVNQGTITMSEAGKRIAEDTSLAQVDPAHDVNSYSSFLLSPDRAIVFDPEVDSQVKAMQPGQISEVMVMNGLEGDTGNRKEAVYIFFKLNETKAFDHAAFEKWLKQKQAANE